MRHCPAGVMPRSRRLTPYEHGAQAVMLPDFNAMSDEAFRIEARAFIESHYPPHLRYILRRARWNETREWYLTLSRHGWIAPNWPRERGGMGLAAGERKVLFAGQDPFTITP